jgi:hypothetical protein
MYSIFSNTDETDETDESSEDNLNYPYSTFSNMNKHKEAALNYNIMMSGRYGNSFPEDLFLRSKTEIQKYLTLHDRERWFKKPLTKLDFDISPQFKKSLTKLNSDIIDKQDNWMNVGLQYTFTRL